MRTLLIGLFVFATACSSKSNDGAPAQDAGTGDDASSGDDTGTSTQRVTDKGKVMDFDTKKPLAGVTVSEGDVTTTTDANGEWTLTPLANTKVTLVFKMDKYTTLQYPEVMISGDTQRETVSALKVDTLNFVGNSLANWDSTKGIVFVGLKLLPSCTDQAGATITVSAPAGSTTNYVNASGVPQGSLTSVQDGQDPGVAVYNVEPNASVEISVSHPKCTMVPFPYTDGTLTYTGNVTTTGAQADTYARYFLK